MKKTLLSLSLLAILFTACKKDQAGSDQKNISTSDPKALTDAITVFHSTKITGTSPVPGTSGNAPVLDMGSDNQQIHALNGRYSVIKPAVTSGTVAGYYFKIIGADFYYKIDFSKPRVSANRLSGNANARSHHFLSGARKFNGNRADSTVSDYTDSSIIIQLPANISPGTFCAQYWMYDAQNQVSNVINVCITVDQLGGGADGAGFTGTWKQTKERYASDYPDTSWHTISNQKDYSYKQPYLCENNQLTYVYDSTSTDPNIQQIFSNYYWTIQSDMSFAANGAAQYISGFEEGFVDLDASTCSNIVYRAEGSPVHEDIGGWSYNSTTKKLVLVFDFNGAGSSDPQAFEFTVTQQSASGFTLLDDQYGDGYQFTKK